MAQREGGDGLAERLGGISLESVGSGEAKPPIGPAGLIHKVPETLHTSLVASHFQIGCVGLRATVTVLWESIKHC